MTPAKRFSPTGTGDRAGRCALVGRPNVGKSTLLNAVLGQKLVITTDRPGTTRTNVLGVHMEPGLQLAFIDTPGIGRAQTALHRVLVEEARSALSSVDAVCLLVEANRKGTTNPGDLEIYETVRETSSPIVVVVNKVDLLGDKSRLLPLLDSWLKRDQVAATVPVSATKGTNVNAIVSELRQLVPEGCLYTDDTLTDRPTRFFATELIREATLRHVRAEVPHGVAVHLDRYSEEGEMLRIDATVFVERDSHKGIVIGRGGSLLKTIGTEARLAIESLVETRVVLKLWVKVAEGWTRDPQRARSLAHETDG